MKELQVAQVIGNLRTVTEFVTGDLKARGCPAPVILRIRVVIDEIFGNIIQHGTLKGSGTVTIREEFEEDPAAIVLTFIDQNDRFNPLDLTDPNISLPARLRRIGGLGIFMVKKSVDAIDYQYKDGNNILKIKKILK